MKAICTHDPTHDRFLTTAHVAQTWKVDENGNFIKEISTDETVADPNPGNIWTCAICGNSATVEND